MIDLGPRSRVAFALLWIGGQAALCVSAASRPDGTFGFRMFPESSTIAIHLQRESAGPGGATIVVDVASSGEWTTKDEHGAVHRFAWTDRVKDPILRNLDVTVNAAYGHRAQLQRLQAALADVLHHCDDGETTALVAHVVVSVNGREPHEIVLRSAR